MIAVVIQARVGSRRLPGKVLKKVFGKTLLEHEILRIKQAKTPDVIVVATTKKKKDQSIVQIAQKTGVLSFRGRDQDVLDRYFQCAKSIDADVIVRITGDCPLVDFQIIDKVVKFFKSGGFDYATCGIDSTFPDGMDVEVFSKGALSAAWKGAMLKSEREHVTSFIWKNPKKFKVGIYRESVNNSNLRLTLDEKEDLTLILKIYKALYLKNKFFLLDDIVRFLAKNPRLLKINQKYARNEGYMKSTSDEKIKAGKLTGDKIFLRDLEVGDVSQKYVRWLNDKNVNKYLETKGADLKSLRRYVFEKMSDPGVIFLGVFDKFSKRHIGNIKLEPVDFGKKTAELGILIGDKNYWGRGVGVEAMDLVCKFAFEKLGLATVTLGVYSAHTSAIKAYEKAGFKFKSKKKDYNGIVMIRKAPEL